MRPLLYVGIGKQIAQLFKLRLALLVVFSACMGYLFADVHITAIDLVMLSIGGMLVTGASNGMNQILERKQDAVMHRTQQRPIPSGIMSSGAAWFISIMAGVAGLAILYLGFHAMAFWLGLGALVSYAFVYTPLKKHSAFAVFIGAFPGAIPPMLGYVAATEVFDLAGGLLFLTQFIWQFPHFWAIAWVLEEDYNRVGYKLLPSAGGRNRNSAFQILLYTLFTVPMGLLPWAFELTGLLSVAGVVVTGLLMIVYAIRLYLDCQVKDARKLMFASFVYLPVVQILYVIDKLPPHG